MTRQDIEAELETARSTNDRLLSSICEGIRNSFDESTEEALKGVLRSAYGYDDEDIEFIVYGDTKYFYYIEFADEHHEEPYFMQSKFFLSKKGALEWRKTVSFITSDVEVRLMRAKIVDLRTEVYSDISVVARIS